MQGWAGCIDTEGRPTEHRDMCNLYRMTKASAEIARLFGARAGEGANFAAEVYPGYPGLVVAEGEARVMTWGLRRRCSRFPCASPSHSLFASRAAPGSTSRLRAFTTRRCASCSTRCALPMSCTQTRATSD